MDLKAGMATDATLDPGSVVMLSGVGYKPVLH